MGQVARLLRALIVAVLVLAAALVGGDFAARAVTEQAIAVDVQKSTSSASSSVTISSFPFLYDVVAEGRLDQLTVTDRGVPAGLLRLDQVRVAASEVRFGRAQLLRDRTVRLVSVQRATITVVAGLSGLESTLARTVGLQVTAASSDHVVVSAAGHTLATLDLTRVALIPKCPLRVSRVGETYTFSCTVSPVPPTLLAALSKYQPG